MSAGRRWGGLLLAAAAGLVLVAGAAAPAVAAGQGQVDIKKVDVSAYPTISVTVSAPGVQGLTPAQVRVTENAQTVPDVRVEPLAAPNRLVDVLLMIDTSGSMQGAPLAAATKAATTFVAGLPPEVRVGLVAFSDRVRPLVRPTIDHARVVAALRTLRSSGETALFDATRAAAAMLGGASQADVILLSDGGDTVSRTGARAAATAVQNAHVTMYTVGLRTAETDVATLKTLAGLTGGRYWPAAAADLTALYGHLAQVISNQYVVSFRSILPRGSQDTVAVRIGDALDVATVWLPGAPRTAAAPPTLKPLAPPLLRGTWGLVTTAILAFIAVFAVLALVLGGAVRRSRRRTLSRRVATAGAAMPPAPEAAGDGPPKADEGPSWIPRPLAGAGERVAASVGFAPRLERRLERAGVPMRPGEFVALQALAALAGLVIGWGLTRIVWVGLILAVAAMLAPRAWLGTRVSRRAARLHEQLPDTLMVLASALRAGHSFMQALDMVAKEIDDPGATEFGRTVAEIRLGRPVDDAMNAMAERIGDPDFGWAVLAINVQREVGGNLAEILENVATTVRERDAVRRQVRALSAEGRLSIWILIAIPVLMVLYMLAVNRDYLGELVSGPLGIGLIITAGTLLVVGLVWMRRVVRIDV